MANMVQHITYKGEKWPIRISYFAIKKFQEETGKEISEIDSNISYLETLLWYGFVAGHNAVNKELILKREEMEFILDESMNEFNEVILSSFPLPGDIKDNENKKK